MVLASGGAPCDGKYIVLASDSGHLPTNAHTLGVWNLSFYQIFQEKCFEQDFFHSKYKSNIIVLLSTK